MKLILFAAVFISSVAGAPMAQVERDRLISHLQMTESWLRDEVSGLSPEQLKFRPAPGKWSILDVVEHLTLAEPGYWDDVLESMRRSASKPKSKAKWEARETYVLWYGVDRTQRQVTSKEETPKSSLSDVQEGLNALHAVRVKMLDYARSTQEDLRGHLYGENGDVYQWFVMISTHMQRHIMQIREVKASAGFP